MAEKPTAVPSSSLGISDSERKRAEIDALLAGRHSDPFAVLGPHPSAGGTWTVRLILPWAAEARVAIKGVAKVADAVKVRPEGFFEATWPSNQTTAPAPGSYKIQGLTHYGDPFEIYDAYAFPFLLSEFDLYLMGAERDLEPLG